MSTLTSSALVDRQQCPLCGCVDRNEFIPFPAIPVVRCGNCMFMYSSKVLPPRELERYYTEDFGGQRHMQGQLVNASVNSMALGRLLDFGRIRNMLDVGTGYGFILESMRDSRRLDVTGLELSQQEADYARQKLGLNVICALPADAGLEKSAYDLVTSFEVIEHVASPIEFLQELAACLKPGGAMIIMTDNFEGRMVRALGAGFPKWIPHTHISHFSAATLRQAIADTGVLEVVDTMSYTPWEMLLRHAYYRLRGIRKTPAEAFNLAAAVENEMSGDYKLFRLRHFLNRTWARLTLSRSMHGDVMYFLCRKVS